MSNSSGLVILSQLYLEHSARLPETDLLIQVEEAKRRRHRSAGEGQNRPSRSFSLFASWRPPRYNNSSHSGAEGSHKLNHSDFVKNEHLDSASSSISPCVTQHLSTVSETVSDSNSDMVNKCEHLEYAKTNKASSSSASSTPSQSFQQFDCSNSSIPHALEPNSSLNSSVPLVTINESDISSQDQTKTATSATELPVLQSSGETSTDNLPNENPSSPSKQSDTVDSEFFVKPNNVVPRKNKKPSEAPTVNRHDIRRSISITEDKLSGQVNEATVRQPSLAVTGRTQSNPGTDLAFETKASMRKMSEDTQSVNSLTTESKPDRTSEFVMKRSQSLKKTNEVLGSLFKASKAAFNKLSELSQTIAIPIKNGSLGSLGSLTHSVEELDTNDGSSTSGTIRERLKYGGSQDLLSHSEESEEDVNNRLSKTSFGKLKTHMLFILL